MTTSLRCLGCRLVALLTSAGVHLAVAAALLWVDPGQLPADDPTPREVGVTLAMFADAGPPGGSPAAPEEAPSPPESDPLPDPEPEPEPEPLAEAVAEPPAEPEPIPDPIPELPPAPDPAPELVAEPAPEVIAPAPQQRPKPVPRPKAKPKPTKVPKVARARPTRAQVQSVAASVPGPAPAVASPVTPGGGTGRAADSASVAAVEGAYLRGLQQAIARNRFYPPGARREDVTGVVTVAFTVQGDGRLGDIRVAKSSGSEVLDQAALETLRRLGSYKPIPAGTGRTRWPVRVPIVFNLR